MSRYFYSDHLAAAWMAKHFGMRFQDHRHLEVFDLIEFLGISYRVVNDGNGHFDVMDESVGQSRYTIHPDSLHLLEPKDGDLVLYTNMARSLDRDGKMLWTGNGIFANTDLPMDVANIIQRNGVAFMWPEQEP